MAIKTSPAGVLVSTPFDGCYSCATRDSFNFYEHVLALVGLTETLVRGAYARAFCFAQDKTKYFCLLKTIITRPPAKSEFFKFFKMKQEDAK